MRIHLVQHVDFEGPGHLAAALASRGGFDAITRLHAGESLPDHRGIDALVVMGGPMGVYDEELHRWLPDEKRYIERCIAAGIPVLGVCLGAQLVADVLGARVWRNRHREIGWFPVDRAGDAAAARAGAALPERFMAFHWHGDTFDLPDGAVALGASLATPCQGFVYQERTVALQFHLEATRGGIADLVSHSGDEIDAGGPYVQDRDAILDAPWFEEANNLAVGLVNAWLQ